MSTVPVLTALVVHWRTEEALSQLLGVWPFDDSRLAMVVVHNGGDDETVRQLIDAAAPGPEGQRLRLLEPQRNLGFAGGVNRALKEAESPWVLIQNPDAHPLPGALEALLAGIDRSEAEAEVVGLAPALVGPDGEDQCEWQLRSLPTLGQLLGQAMFLDTGSGPRLPPAQGTPVEQPAAAALALEKRALDELGGFDEGFWPAWFEDVDVARRLHERGQRILYWPASRFEHGLGSTVPRLGYGRFLVTYYRNLMRYLAKHHRGSAPLARCLLMTTAVLRALLVPIKRPSRARTRAAAFTGLLRLAREAASGFPSDTASTTSKPSQ